MKNYPNDKDLSDNIQKNQAEGFFQKIYRYCINLIQRNPKSNDRETNKKLNESFNHYAKYYQNAINYNVKDPSNSKIGLINLLNDCYIVTFLQILFHTPNFMDILKKFSIPKGETIINYLIAVSEYPFNVEYFYKLKQLLGQINPEYSKPWSNDSQEFGIDLINYLISETKGQIYEDISELNLNKELDFVTIKKIVYEDYIDTYQKNTNELEKLFLFNQIDIYCGNNFQNPKISSNLHMELTLQKYQSYIELEKLIEDKYKSIDNKLNQNQFVINSKIVSLPEILIISINRVLNNEYINNSKLLFKDTLDLKDHIDYDLFQDNNKKTTYHLYAVNECIHTYRSSHYICYIKLENKWFIFDDDRKVEEFYGSFKNSPFIVGLFYKRDC